jgi:hypothetical protein
MSVLNPRNCNKLADNYHRRGSKFRRIQSLAVSKKNAPAETGARWTF